MIKEFRDFINKGNLMDIAVGFLMGAAFVGLVTAFTDSIINPAIGLIIPGLDDLTSLGTFGEGGSFGAFLGAVINFLIVAIVIFFMVKAYNRMRRTVEEEPSAPSEEVVLLTEIRDSLRDRRV